MAHAHPGDPGRKCRSAARTPLIPATMPVEQIKSFGQQAPIGRAAQPVEVAPAFVFLASQEFSYVAGETIAVTGGTPLP
jgi:NAD(P)-dependent dehydrogenase (short-subunit alcohol dehydrogenase family)